MERKKVLVFITTLSVISFLISAALLTILTTNMYMREADILLVDEYEIFFIEGMPCVRVPRADGMSCDWSKWAGR